MNPAAVETPVPGSRGSARSLDLGGATANLGDRKGEALVGCSSTGNNVYFLRPDRLREPLRDLTAGEAFIESRFRESRDLAGRLTYLEGAARLEEIASMKVWDVTSEQLVTLG